MVITFTSRVNIMNENTLSEPKASESLYFVMSSISLVKYRCLYENMVCIKKSIVNVKHKQT